MGYAATGFSWLFSVPPGEYRYIELEEATTASFIILTTEAYLPFSVLEYPKNQPIAVAHGVRTWALGKALKLQASGLTPWGRALLEKIIVAQLVKKFPTFYGTRRFIIVFTRARQWSLSCSRWIQSTASHPSSVRYILRLSAYLHLGYMENKISLI